MNYKVINKQILAEGVKRLDISAPKIAQRIQPGQFVHVRPTSTDEAIPLSVIEMDPQKGTIALIVQERGATSQKLGGLSINEAVYAMLGPLGMPAQIDKIEKKGVMIAVATGIGTAQILPICRTFKQRGHKVIGIIGAKSKKKLILEAQMRLCCDKIFITTEDGSHERRGLATDFLKTFIQQQEEQNADMQAMCVYAIGSVEMMEAVCQLTKIKKIKTWVQLSPVMWDCVGLCGACRVSVGGKTVLACLDGPEFNGHKVDFSNLRIRMQVFEEGVVWEEQKGRSSRKKDALKISRKFLSDIPRN